MRTSSYLVQVCDTIFEMLIMRFTGFFLFGIKSGLLLAFIIILGSCNSNTYNSLPDYYDMTDEELDQLIKTGMNAWRMNGSIETGASCASCHAPDGFDLAFIRFSDFDIRRRGSMHVGKGQDELNASRLEDIINMIHALRVKHNINPQDPFHYRPFQPGSEILESSGGLNSDYQFGQHLKQKNLIIINKDIHTFDDAKKSRNELINLNLWDLNIGISLNLWSIDHYSGSDSFALADWLPVLPLMPKSGKEQQWYLLHDEYLANPTIQLLEKILTELEDLAEVPFSENGAVYSTQKYKAMLIAQHMFRKHKTSQQDATSAEKIFDTLFIRNNPFWEIGILSYNKNLQLPEDIESRYSWFNSIDDQLVQTAIPWLWLGWMADYSSNARLCDQECTGILTDALLQLTQPYYIHHALIVAMHFIQYGIHRYDISKLFPAELPVSSGQRKLYTRMLENILRAEMLQLAENSFWQTDPYSNEILRHNLAFIEEFFVRINSNFIIENLQIIDSVRQRLSDGY
jgi:hypothetical protein